jgi:hypothetical protein
VTLGGDGQGCIVAPGVTAVFIYIEKIEQRIFSIPIPPLFFSTRSARCWLRIEDSQPAVIGCFQFSLNQIRVYAKQ